MALQNAVTNNVNNVKKEKNVIPRMNIYITIYIYIYVWQWQIQIVLGTWGVWVTALCKLIWVVKRIKGENKMRRAFEFSSAISPRSRLSSDQINESTANMCRDRRRYTNRERKKEQLMVSQRHHPVSKSPSPTVSYAGRDRTRLSRFNERNVMYIVYYILYTQQCTQYRQLPSWTDRSRPLQLTKTNKQLSKMNDKKQKYK